MNKLNTYILIFVLFLNSYICYSQKENNNWYFGRYAGITFNTSDGEPIALSNLKMDQSEGTAAISDKDGNLLFYTDGIKVWGKSHNVMQNGTGLFGGSSSSNSALIVPNPKVGNIYYIFTAQDTRVDMSKQQGINYSVVDMSLNGGSGVVTQKNISLYKPSCEKLAAVWNRTDNFIWVISHDWDSNIFRAFRVTEDGVDPNPVISAAGKIHTGNTVVATGRLTVSPDGLSLAVPIPYLDGIEKNSGYVELFNFNPVTGKVSHPRTLDIKNPTYSLVYSPDGKYLYVRTNGFIEQYDVSKCKIQDILDSRTEIAKNTGSFYNAMEMGPNNKIYILFENQKYLGSINSPNLKGSLCQYVNNSVDLKNGMGTWGLPTFLNSNYYFKDELPDIRTVDVCEGNSLILNAGEIKCALKYEWYRNSVFLDSGEVLVIPETKIETTGDYICVVSFEAQEQDTIFYKVTVHPSPVAKIEPNTDELVLCDFNTVLKAAVENSSFTCKWSTGETTPEITVNKSGKYSVMIQNEFGCKDSAFINVIFDSSANVKIITPDGKDFCNNDSLLLASDKDYSTYLWNTGETTKSIYAKSSGWYYLSVNKNSKCEGMDSVYVNEIIYNLNAEPVVFGEICSNTKTIITSELKNTGPSNPVIQKFYLKNNDVFKLTFAENLPIELTPEKAVSYNIEFNPAVSGKYNDTLIINIGGFCPQEMKIPVTGKTIPTELTIEIKDTIGETGQNFCITVYGDLNCKEVKIEKIIFTIEYISDLFQLLNLTNGVILENKKIGNLNSVKIELHDITLNSSSNILTELCGKILLSNTDSTGIVISEIEEDRNMVVYKNSGSLKTNDFCVKDLRLVQWIKKGVINAVPNPSENGEISLISENLITDRYTVSVYNVNGQKVFEDIWDYSAAGNLPYLISTKELSTGIYNVVISSSSRLFNLTLNVIK